MVPSPVAAAAALALPSLASILNASFTARDFTHCDTYYSLPRPPSLSDCVKALDHLPRGHVPVTWYNEELPEVPSEYVLPLVSTYRSCQIKIEMSGKFQQESPFQMKAPPDDLRAMAQLAIDRCVTREQLGGYATYGFKSLIDWITNPSTVFPGDLHLPPSITFFTATVWNYKPSLPDVEPGSQDEWSAVEIRRNLESAAERAPAGSRLRLDLQAREWYVYDSEQAIISRGEALENGYYWWSGPRHNRVTVTNSSTPQNVDTA
ncbi:MAG: hypothetical protein LQ352_000061 [Teloschistes flavicans]|nr:MAG: hypothetical protein LQ352_000061 [Teloschistes flavicans]